MCDESTTQSEESTSRVRAAVLISGRGSNMMALVEAAQMTDYPAEIVLVVSNRADAPGIRWAQERGIATRVIDHMAFAERSAFEDAIHHELVAHGIELVALAGFMRILTEDFVQRWRGRMLNVHPSLLPMFKGLNTHARAIESGQREGGCTVHFVDCELDGGAPILKAPVPILDGDTPETLAARVLVEEHKIYPIALAWLASGKVNLKDGQLCISGELEIPDGCAVPEPRENCRSA